MTPVYGPHEASTADELAAHARLDAAVAAGRPWGQALKDLGETSEANYRAMVRGPAGPDGRAGGRGMTAASWPVRALPAPGENPPPPSKSPGPATATRAGAATAGGLPAAPELPLTALPVRTGRDH